MVKLSKLQRRTQFLRGLSSKLAANEGAALESQVAGVVGAAAVNEINTAEAAAAPPEGFYNASTGQFAPPAGGFVDVATGLYVAPPPGSTYDATAGVYVPPASFGGFDAASGEYVAPAGVELNADGSFQVTDSSLATADALPTLGGVDSVGEAAFASADTAVSGDGRLVASADGGAGGDADVDVSGELEDIDDSIATAIEGKTPTSTRVNVTITVN